MNILSRLFNSPEMAALKKGMDGAAVRHRAIANNIANVSTPGYKRQVVDFESELWDALKGSGSGLTTTHPKHFGGGSGGIQGVCPQIEQDKRTTIRVDQNTVNIDQEMVDLTKNAGRYAERAALLNRMYSQLRSAISGNVR